MRRDDKKRSVRESIMNNESIKLCQSCGMPLDKAEHFGTDPGGTKNEEYCHYCFENGKFKDQGISMEEKIKKNILIATKMGIPEKKAIEMAKIIPTLKRWMK
jgi:hypothetical protein